MPFRHCILRSPALVVVAALFVAGIPAAYAAANHVVISEFATRGPSSASDEFVELYNPTGNAIDISGWKMQYKATSSTIWNDRVILPANSSIPAHGFFLLANQSYVGSVTPDYSSGLWNSGSGMADNGHERILDASLVEVDKVGWGTAIDPEGGSAAPNHGTSANSNSVERKATAASTADSLAAGGLHVVLGNGQDTNVNGSDYVTQTHGRTPQNALSTIEPAFSTGGNGTGRATASPTPVYASTSVDTLKLAFKQDSAYTVTKIAIFVPTAWTWSHSAASVVLSGAAFGAASASVTGDTIFVNSAALTQADSGTVAIVGMTAPATNGVSVFNTRTAVAAGTLTQTISHPQVRVLLLVPISFVHVNDASGVCASPYQVGAEATVTGIVTVNYNATRTDVYMQDASGGINLFSNSLPAFTINAGDSLTVTGNILQFRGITEIQPDFNFLVRHATGRPIPDPLVLTCADVNATFHPDYTEPNEGRLVRLYGVTYNSVNSTITDGSGTTNVFIPNTYPPTPTVFDIIGILKQFKPGTPAPGPPYTSDYEITPRTPDDIIAHPGPVFTTTPYEDNLHATTVEIHWTTDVPSTSIVRYGLTSALGDSATDTTHVTTHVVTLTGLTPSTIYTYSAGSTDDLGTNFSPNQLFSTASPPATSGVMNVYFNKSVDTSLQWIHAANGNSNLPALLAAHIDNAKRSVDAALYSLSSTPGTTLANALINAKNRGVKVRVICENDNKNTTAFNSLVSAGITLVTDTYDAANGGLGLMHNKFMSIDSRGGAPESAWVWMGSWNPTQPGTNDDYQNAVEIQDQALANTYTREFNEMWGSSTDTPNASASRFGARKLDDTPHKFLIGGRKVECYFSPSDGVTAKIIALMNAAQHSIGFQDLTITRTDISATLVARKTAGLKVRGDMDNNTDTGSQYGYLIGQGIDVHLKTGSGLLHHKYAIFDAENPAYAGVTLTGSHNWSSAAENSNNENTLVIHDADITNQYLQEFAARYYQFGGSDSIQVPAAVPGGVGAGRVALMQNFPNPFHRGTNISYAIPSVQRVTLKLYEVTGREVKTLVNKTQQPGVYQVQLNAAGLGSGVYFYRLNAGGTIQEKKLLLLK